MGIRQAVNDNPVLTITVTAVLMVAALAFIVFHSSSKPAQVKFPNKSYYSDDDGKTWYLDDATNIPPYQHNGREGVRAILFRCNGGKPFIQRLEQFDDEAKTKIEEQMKNGVSPLAAQYFFASRGMMVKKPGDAKWSKLQDGDPEGARNFSKIMQPRCPDGSTENISPVSTEENAKPD